MVALGPHITGAPSHSVVLCMLNIRNVMALCPIKFGLLQLALSLILALHSSRFLLYC